MSHTERTEHPTLFIHRDGTFERIKVPWSRYYHNRDGFTKWAPAQPVWNVPQFSNLDISFPALTSEYPEVSFKPFEAKQWRIPQGYHGLGEVRNCTYCGRKYDLDEHYKLRDRICGRCGTEEPPHWRWRFSWIYHELD